MGPSRSCGVQGASLKERILGLAKDRERFLSLPQETVNGPRRSTHEGSSPGWIFDFRVASGNGEPTWRGGSLWGPRSHGGLWTSPETGTGEGVRWGVEDVAGPGREGGTGPGVQVDTGDLGGRRELTGNFLER